MISIDYLNSTACFKQLTLTNNYANGYIALANEIGGINTPKHILTVEQADSQHVNVYLRNVDGSTFSSGVAFYAYVFVVGNK